MQDIPALPAVTCSQCSTSAAIVFDRPTGRVARFVPVRAPNNDPPADSFSHGPLSKFAPLCGWERGDNNPPGSGTQSFLFCPLISLGLAVAKSRMAYSTGNRRSLLSILGSGLPTHFPSSVHTPLIFVRWTVTNLQLHCCSRGKVVTWILLQRR